MASYTEHCGLVKPDPQDFYDIGVSNQNMDTLDGYIAELAKLNMADNFKSGDMKDLASKKSGHYIIYPEVTGMPIDGRHWWARTSCGGPNEGIWITATDMLSGDVYSNLRANSFWYGWRRLVTEEELAGKANMRGFTADLDTATEDGIYWFAGSTANKPEGLSDGVLLVQNSAATYHTCHQTIINGMRFGANIGAVLLRTKTSSDDLWLPWQRLVTEEELEKKVDGGWRIYTSLQELNLTEGTETIQTMVEAMQDRSTLIVAPTNSFNASLYPEGNLSGMLEIQKIATNRCKLSFTRHRSNSFWVGVFYDKFLGWERVQTQ